MGLTPTPPSRARKRINSGCDDATFSSGTPRWYIKFDNGGYLFGYPYDHAWDAHTTTGGCAHGTYKAMVAYLTTQSGGTLPDVKKVRIIADGSAQQFPYTTFLSEVRYAGQNLTK